MGQLPPSPILRGTADALFLFQSIDIKVEERLKESLEFVRMINQISKDLSELSPLPPVHSALPISIFPPDIKTHPLSGMASLWCHAETLFHHMLKKLCRDGVDWRAAPSEEWQAAIHDTSAIHAVVALLEQLTILLTEIEPSSIDSVSKLLGFDGTLRLMAHFLSQCVKDHPPNQACLAEYQHCVLHYIGSRFGFVDTITTLYTNNFEVLSALSEGEIDAIFKQMLEVYIQGRGPRFVALLSVLCICDGKPIQKIQNMISKSLLAHPELLLEVLLCSFTLFRMTELVNKTLTTVTGEHSSGRSHCSRE